MKTMKKTLALLLAVMMCMSLLSVVAMAEPTNDASITINTSGTDKHTYKVYQIFTGELTTNDAGKEVLSNLKYGANYGTEGNAVPKAEADAITDAAAFAKQIMATGANPGVSGEPVATLTKSNEFTQTGLTTGYYLIVDDTAVASLDEGDSLSAYIVQVSGATVVAPKKDTVTTDKKITTDTLGKDDATTTVNGKVDNVSIGDTVNFEITGTVPSHATDYDYYYFIIGDKLSEGLTFGGVNTIVVKAGDDTLVKDTDYYVYTGEDGYTFQVALADAIAHAGETITVTYSATLNEKAKIGEDANTNTVEIEYSNNPNNKYDGTTDKEKPGKPDSNKDVPTGKTPESTTETYTTGIQIQKVDQAGQPLTGAEFTITGDNMEIVLVSTEEFKLHTGGGTGDYYKLANNTYTTEAPQTEDKMVAAPEGADAGYVEAEEGYTGDDAVTVGGKLYREYKAETDSEKTIYILQKKNDDLYASVTETYDKEVTFTQKDTNTTNVTATASVGEDGVVIFEGLGKGTYTITETKTPAGYDTIAPQTVTIDFTANPAEGGVHWTKTSGDATYNATSGLFEITIENVKGNPLPETGGIGTKIFYTMGAVLVIGAGVVLVSRKRAAE